MATACVRGLGQLGHDGFHERACVRHVAGHDGQDGVERHVVVTLVPAVVVGRHGDGRVVQLGFAREFGLGQVRHADDVDVPSAVQLGLGARRELGAFHADVGATVVRGHARCRAGCQQRAADAGADRVGELHVRHASPTEEGVGTMARAIDELVDDDEVTGRDVLAHRADGGDRDDVRDAQGLHAPDVRAVIDLGRRPAMATSVTRQEHHAHAVERALDVGIARISEGRREGDLFDVLQTIHRVQTGAAEDSYHQFRHRVHPRERPRPPRPRRDIVESPRRRLEPRLELPPP